MNYSRSKYFIIIYWLFFFGVKAQNTEEINKMTGTEPREPEATGAVYYPIKTVFDSPFYYTSCYAVNISGNKRYPETKINFLFNKLNILTTYPSVNPKSRLRVLGEIDNITDKDHSYRRLQCKDNAGNYVAVAIAYEFSTKTEIIIFIYSNSTYYYEVNSAKIPLSVIDVIDNEASRELFLKSLELPYQTQEEIKNFFREFGSIEKVVKFICNE